MPIRFLKFRKRTAAPTPRAGEAHVYVNDADAVVVRKSDGSQIELGAGETVEAHEAEADPHPQYLELDT